MGRPFRAIRPDERRDTWAAFLTLFGFLASHSILETARDALFLAKVPAQRLPWVFLAIAFVSLLVSNLQSRLSARLSGRPAVAAWTVVAGTITFAFWWLLGRMGSAGLYALYVWSGVLTSLVLVHFWTLLGNVFSVTQAKRLYGLIGAGSVLGAIVGSGTASVLSRLVAPGQLLLASAIGFLVTSGLPLLFTARGGAEKASGTVPMAGLLDNARYVARQPYARGVVLLMFSSATCLTIGDYLFKATVADHFTDKAHLASFLATFYFALNVLSLASQLILVSWVVRRFAISTALAILPALLLVGGLGLAAALFVGGAMVGALVIKTADGGLRYSLHRTASELLFLPFGEEARRRVKAFIDVVGQRGGQALASVTILAVTASRWHNLALAVVLIVLASLWIASALKLRAPYVELFRTRLKAGRVQHLEEFPELDVASLETLVASLDSAKENEVTTALDVLEREKKAYLVPALILYHPSDGVVEQALSLFTRAKRKNVIHVIDRLVEHPSPRVRAATIAARSVLDPDAQRLLMRLAFEDSPEVRATIVINLIASGEIFGSDARERIDGFLLRGSRATKVALAEAIARREAPGFTDAILALAKMPDVEVRLAALGAMGRLKSKAFFPALLDLHGDETTRRKASQVLLDCGADGFAALVAALADETMKPALRGRFPHAISLFDPKEAAKALITRLPTEKEGMVRYQILRALESLARRDADLALDRPILDSAIEGTVRRAYRYLDQRLIVMRGIEAVPSRATPGQKVLEKLLRDKEQNAIERLFRLLALAYPIEDFNEIYRGLRSGRKDTHASSMELIENALEEPLRRGVLGLVDDAGDEERLRASGKYLKPLGVEYEALLEHMLKGASHAVQDVAAFHVGELGLVRFRDIVASLPHTDETRTDLARTLALLSKEATA